MRSRRIVSSALFTTGLLLVLGGLVAAQGFTFGGTIASIAVVIALMYAGGLWLRDLPTSFPPARTRAPLLFDREGRALTGPSIGHPITSAFPETLRPEIERRCAAALAGASARFVCLDNGAPVAFDALPVRDADGAIVYGLLITAAEPPEPATTRVVA